MPRQIPLLNSPAFALVDDADYAFLSQWQWRRNNKGYAVRSELIAGKRVYFNMHRHHGCHTRARHLKLLAGKSRSVHEAIEIAPTSADGVKNSLNVPSGCCITTNTSSKICCSFCSHLVRASAPQSGKLSSQLTIPSPISSGYRSWRK